MSPAGEAASAQLRPRRTPRTKEARDKESKSDEEGLGKRSTRRSRVPTPKARDKAEPVQQEDSIAFGEIEAAMGNLGWTWIQVGISYIYIAPHAFRKCNGKNYTSFQANVDYILTQERFEKYVRQNAELMKKIKENLEISKRPYVARKGRTHERHEAETRQEAETQPNAQDGTTEPPSMSSSDSSDDEPLLKKVRCLQRAPSTSSQSSEEDTSDDEPLVQKVAKQLRPPPLASSSPSTGHASPSNTSSDDEMIARKRRKRPASRSGALSRDKVVLQAPPSPTSTMTTENIDPIALMAPKLNRPKSNVSKIVPPRTINLPPLPAIFMDHPQSPSPTDILEQLEPSAVPIPPLASTPILHRENVWRKLQDFVDKCFKDAQNECITLEGPPGCGKTLLLKYLELYARSRIHEFQSKHDIFVVYAPMSGTARVVDDSVTEGFFDDLASHFQAAMADCTFDPQQTTAKTVCEQAFNSVSMKPGDDNDEEDEMLQAKLHPRNILLLIDGLNLRFHARERLDELFEMLHGKHDAIVNMVVTTTGNAESYFHRHVQNGLGFLSHVITLSPYGYGAIFDILAARLVDFGPFDEMAFVARLVAHAFDGDASVAVGLCRCALEANGTLTVGGILKAAKNISLEIRPRTILACLPRVQQIIIYAAVMEYYRIQGVYDFKSVHRVYSEFVLHFGYPMEKTLDEIRREVDWLVANELASKHATRDAFTLFITQDSALAFFKENPVSVLLQTVRPSTKPNFQNTQPASR
ncbi:hypothetical protein LEN26_005577 [Aphanomyces euteiches]|nr:hypothetical protein LEN26_005577 [Aphanomyces euteiches]